MTNYKRNFNNVFVTILLGLVFLFCFAIAGIINREEVYADTKAEQLSVEDYTSNDRLLLKNGTLSNKTIQIFAKEVQQASNGSSCPELAEVIPLQYLISQENQAVFSYNGQEYGFYVVKDGSYFDTLSLG